MLFAQRLRPDQVIRTGVTEPFGIRQESPVRVAQGIVPAFVAQARAAGPLGPTSQPAAYGSSVHIQAAAALIAAVRPIPPGAVRVQAPSITPAPRGVARGLTQTARDIYAGRPAVPSPGVAALLRSQRTVGPVIPPIQPNAARISNAAATIIAARAAQNVAAGTTRAAASVAARVPINLPSRQVTPSKTPSRIAVAKASPRSPVAMANARAAAERSKVTAPATRAAARAVAVTSASRVPTQVAVARAAAVAKVPTAATRTVATQAPAVRKAIARMVVQSRRR